MISAPELIKKYFTPVMHQEKDQDLIQIEALVVNASIHNKRECQYPIVTAKYSTAMNALKELGYKVTSELHLNKEITTLTISW